MKPFMGNPCGYGHCMREDCEECPNYKPTCFGIRVPRWLAKHLYVLEMKLMKGN